MATHYQDPDITRFDTCPDDRFCKDMQMWVYFGKWYGGHFLTAVFESDLFGAIARADNKSMRNLKPLCQFIYSHLPASCWGSPDKMKEWAESGGLAGQQAAWEEENRDKEGAQQ